MKNIQYIFLLFCLLASAQSKANTSTDQPKPTKANMANLVIFMTIPGIPGELDFNTGTNIISDAIEITNYSLDSELPISLENIKSVQRGYSQPIAPNFEFSLYMENAVIDFYKKMMGAVVIPVVQIFVFRPINGFEFEKVEEINLKAVYISSISNLATADANAPVLHKTIMKFQAIKKIGYTYGPGGNQTPNEFLWNYEKGKAEY